MDLAFSYFLPRLRLASFSIFKMRTHAAMFECNANGGEADSCGIVVQNDSADVW